MLLMEEQTPAGTVTAESLIADCERIGKEPCRSCSHPICHHEALMSMAMGFKARPLCQGCLAKALEQDVAALRTQVFGYIQRRDCYRAAWEWASVKEGFSALQKVACVFPAE